MKTENFIEENSVCIDKVYYKNHCLHLLRLDKIHSIISGNKFFKLKYNIEEALEAGNDTILTFGGAFSNHIAATAHAAKLVGLRSIGIIRGEEVSNPTLDFAKQEGMQLVFIDRQTYRVKHEPHYIASLHSNYGDFYLIPEGGTNALAIKGTGDIHHLIPNHFSKIACCVGTGGTLSGLINASKATQKIIGFSALKGDWINEAVDQYVVKSNWSINTSYHFGGYAKWKPELIEFINQFYKTTNVPLDPIYTGKMLYGITDLLEKEEMKSENLLIIHSGGLQGIEGFNKRFGNIIET